MDQEEHEDEFAKLEYNYRNYLHQLLQDLAHPEVMNLRSDAFHLWLGLKSLEDLKTTLEMFEQYEYYEECVIIKQYIDEY